MNIDRLCVHGPGLYLFLIGYFLFVLVFAYGATGAGKTHTMLGTADDPGITYLTAAELYRRAIEKTDVAVDFRVSYLEVRNVLVESNYNWHSMADICVLFYERMACELGNRSWEEKQSNNILSEFFLDTTMLRIGYCVVLFLIHVPVFQCRVDY